MTAMVKATAAMRSGAVLGSAILLLGLAGAARAYPDPDPVDLKVIDRETGQALPMWRRDGRLFVAGEQGVRYGLRVTNHTDGRVLVVLSVDGVNILTGETAKYVQRGYIFGPHESYDLNGWRKSTTQIAAFAFAALPQSYAAETGRPGDVGVIGMAVFRERAPPPVTPLAVSPAPFLHRPAPPADIIPPPPLPLPRVQRPLALPAPAPPPAPPPVVTAQRIAPRPAPAPNQFASDAAPTPSDEKLGTAHGALEWSVSNIVPFERATPYPIFVRQIEYDSYANLAASGVIPRAPHPGPAPRAFPPNQPGFVPDPPPRF